MKISKKISEFLAKAKLTDAYWIEKAKLDFSTALERHRRLADMSYTDVARAINTSPAYITKVFRGDSNLTIETMVKLARATGAHLHIDLNDQQIAPQRWAKLAKWNVIPFPAGQQAKPHYVAAPAIDFDAAPANGTYGA